MSKKGRFGKYGEEKRKKNLRQSRMLQSVSDKKKLLAPTRSKKAGTVPGKT